MGLKNASAEMKLQYARQRQQEHRPPHDQTILETPEPGPVTFEGAQFIAYIEGIKTRKGQVVLEFVIPPEFNPNAVPMLDAFYLPLSVDVRVWNTYLKAVEGE